MICSRCGTERAADRFAAGRRVCKDCANARYAEQRRVRRLADPEWRAKQRVANNDYKIAMRYGITREQYDAMLAAQGGVCASCHRPPTGQRRFHVDHDHACCGPAKACERCVRGLLCSPCNVALGMLADDPDRITALLAYRLSTQKELVMEGGAR